MEKDDRSSNLSVGSSSAAAGSGSDAADSR